MLKKLLIVLALAFTFVSAANRATAEPPWPECYPCPSNPD